MKLPTIMLPLLILLFNNNCGLVNRSNMPVEHNAAEQQEADTGKTIATTFDTSSGKIRFGVMISKSDGMNIPPEKQAQIAKALGVNYTRARIDIKTWNGSNSNYDAYTNAGLKVLLNVNYGIPRNAMGNNSPIPFPTDMAEYSNSINSILNKYKPEVLVVENEEDNPLYHTGSAFDYLTMLKTAIDIAHKRGIKVTNGGITVREVCLVVYDDLVQKGKEKEAREFIESAAPPALLQRLNKINNPMVQRQIEFGRDILAAYKTLNLDYVNFHWYEPVRARGKGAQDVQFDPKVLAFVANYLKTATGKPVMTNEFGVLNASPELVKNVLQVVKDADIKYAIFYSADGEGEGKAIALQGGNGELRDNGIAFRDFIKQLH